MPSQQKGFSITEIIVVLLIISILVLVLLPGLNKYIIRSNRSDGIKSILAIQIAQEKWRISNTSYGTLANVWSGPTNTTNSYQNYYRMGVTNNTTSTYTITATALGSQTADTPSSCTTLTLTTTTNGTAQKTPSVCWQ